MQVRARDASKGLGGTSAAKQFCDSKILSLALRITFLKWLGGATRTLNYYLHYLV